MLEPSKLPDGVHVEVNADERTVDIVNRSPNPFAVSPQLTIGPGERRTFQKGERMDCFVVCTPKGPRDPPTLHRR